MVMIILYFFLVAVAAALTPCGTVSTPHIGCSDGDSLDESGLYQTLYLLKLLLKEYIIFIFNIFILIYIVSK